MNQTQKTAAPAATDADADRLRRIREALADYRMSRPGTPQNDRAVAIGRIVGIAWDTGFEERKFIDAYKEREGGAG